MLRWLVRIVLAVVVIVVGGAYLMPQNVHVGRSTEIAAPPAKIFAIINNHKRFNEWSPWAELDPKTQYTYSGPATGVGSKMAWSSTNSSVGSGSQEIVESIADKSVVVKLDLGDMGKADAALTLEPAGAGTKVTWGVEIDVGMNPIGRWTGLMLDRWIGADYEKGLGRLKSLAEKP